MRRLRERSCRSSNAPRVAAAAWAWRWERRDLPDGPSDQLHEGKGSTAGLSCSFAFRPCCCGDRLCGHALLPWRYSRILLTSANRLTAGAGACSSGGVSSLRRMRVHHTADGAGALTAARPGYPTQIRVPAVLHWLQEGDASCCQAATPETGEDPPPPGTDGADGCSDCCERARPNCSASKWLRSCQLC